ncbi:phosphatase PAP2 family protein [Lactobacillus terrae]|uniref:phosphatase PAP2 family protein n=1 Tax=Lactobacillus terrae TaxID=2269374 RepID=UPI000C1B76BF|nr:phosphatase PAP2 family protein [Lactobacillus terrae]
MTAQRKGIIGGISIIVLIMLIGTFYDWQISQALINQNSLIGTIFQDFGLWPLTLVIILSSMVVVNYELRISNQSTLIRLIAALGALTLGGWELWRGYLKTTLYYSLALKDNLDKHAPIAQANSDGGNLHLSWLGNFSIWIIIYLVIIGLSQIWLSQKSSYQMDYLLKVAIVATLACFLADNVNSAMKTYWGRWRPYELAGNSQHFTMWIFPNGADNHLSFPSGHTTAAAAIMLLPMFVDRSNIKLQKITFWISLAYCIIMWYTRIRVGAHFTTDATSGLWITWLIFFIVLSVTNMHLISKDSYSINLYK